MKLAEALAERSAIRKKIDALSSRLEKNSKVFEGEEPVEDPKRLLEELNILTSRHEELIFRINTANAVTAASNGETLARLLARRDTLADKVGVLNALLRSTEKERPFYRNKDSLKEIVTVDVRSVREEADALAKSVREIDTMIQEANWSTNI
ncbi:MAG: DIP1984 family protein [Candidatus Methanomethylophilaceae archaeon]|nr:DIP1984 family protein [Candidatus Methanomethylophilaceae archaeon]